MTWHSAQLWHRSFDRTLRLRNCSIGKRRPHVEHVLLAGTDTAADAHQPCHTGSLYAEGVFPEGDRGANSIPTKQMGNLHALWDRLLGPRYDSGDVARRIREIRADVALWNDARAAGRVVEPLEWLRESQELARRHVYSPEILNAIEAAQRSGASEIEEINLPEPYLKSAGVVAQRQAAFAAFRLAAMFKAD